MSIKTTDVSKAWAPDSTSFPFEDVVGDALYNSLTTKGGEIDGDAPSLRVPYVTDDDSADFVAEGAEIGEGGPSLDELVLHSRKIGKIVRLSSEMYGKPSTPQVVANSVQRELTRRLDKALLIEPSHSGEAPSTGLLNVADLLEVDPVIDNLDPLVDAIAEVGTNGGTATTLLLSPDAWSHLFKMKRGTAAGNVGLLSPATETPNAPILGMQVRVSNVLPAATGLLIDPGAIVSATSAIQVATSMDAAFTSDSIVYRATVRCGHKVVKPNRIVKLTIGEDLDD